MRGSTILVALLGAQLSIAQQWTTVTTSGTSTAAAPAHSASLQAEPCAQVAAISASYVSAYPSASANPHIPYDIMSQCLDSVPLDIDDTSMLLDTLLAFLQFQSDLEFQANPPPGYLLAGEDIVGAVQALQQAVQNSSIQGEIDFELSLQEIYAQAYDGHLAFRTDGTSVYNWGRHFGSLVSVSLDGVQPPKVYFYDDIVAYANGEGQPSAITNIDGMDATSFILQQMENGTIGGFQDPDALFNSYLWTYNDGSDTGPSFGLFSESLGYIVPESNTSIAFENGTTAESQNYGIALSNWSGVTDGDSFYQAFCNATLKEKAMSSTGASSSITQTATASNHAAIATATGTDAPTATAPSASSASATATRITGYPLPLVISSDGAASGYFLDQTGYEDTAVLALRSMSEGASESFQETITKFLNRCRAANKTRLVLDVQGNPGGDVGLGYDVFKQLFPSIVPYGTFNFRAHEGFRLLGESITPLSANTLQQDPNNVTIEDGSDFDALEYLNASGQPYQSFDPFYGPVVAPNDYGNYTSLARLNLSNAEFDEAHSSIVISGYANNTYIAPSPFSSENIILLTDGQCSSTCTILAHFLKWQGKVKSIAMGGRPSNTGAMQAIGGIKGSEVEPFADLAILIGELYEKLDNATLETFNGTSLEVINNNAYYLMLRSASAGTNPAEISVNFQNNIAEGDTSITPLQFVYEAADCRMYFTPQHIANISSLWYNVAANAFGLNGTSQFSQCVNGSTNQPSSLSGNPQLYNNGQPNNVTNTNSSSY